MSNQDTEKNLLQWNQGRPQPYYAEYCKAMGIPGCYEPVDCEVGPWSNWTPCSTDKCGGGTSGRTRLITKHPEHGGLSCPPLAETKNCATDPCPHDCIVSPWTDWGDCTAPCEGGLQRRSRRILQAGEGGGKACPTDLVETESCNIQPCPVDCEVSDWCAWGTCMGNCGDHATVTRTRTVVQEAENGGQTCPPLSETQGCPYTECPQDCVLGDWQKTGTCVPHSNIGDPVVCQIKKTRPILVQAGLHGKPCPDPSERIMITGTCSCPKNCEVGNWSSWGACTGPCGSSRQQTSTRSVTQQPDPGGNPCPDLTRTQPCIPLGLPPALGVGTGSSYKQIFPSGLFITPSPNSIQVQGRWTDPNHYIVNIPSWGGWWCGQLTRDPNQVITGIGSKILASPPSDWSSLHLSNETVQFLVDGAGVCAKGCYHSHGEQGRCSIDAKNGTFVKSTTVSTEGACGEFCANYRNSQYDNHPDGFPSNISVVGQYNPDTKWCGCYQNTDLSAYYEGNCVKLDLSQC